LIWSPASHHPLANVTRAARGKNTRPNPFANEMNPGPVRDHSSAVLGSEQHGDRGHDGENGEREEHCAEGKHHGVERGEPVGGHGPKVRGRPRPGYSFCSVISKMLPSGSRK
jgi:hypothetical protein